MTAKATPPAAPRDPTVREMRATLARLYSEVDNHGRSTQTGAMFQRAYDHMAWLLDSYLFDTDTWANDGGRS